MTERERKCITTYVSDLIEKWAEDNKRATESWATCDRDHKNADKDCKEFIEKQKEAFNRFISTI